MRKLIIAGVMVLSTAGCTTPAQPGSAGGVTPSIQPEANRQFDLAVGQEARIQGTQVSVRFNSVGEDSRCPSDVQCVWAGNAVVRLSFSSSEGASTEASLNTTLDPKTIAYGGYIFRLLDLKPAPKSGTRIPAAEYVATLEAVK